MKNVLIAVALLLSGLSTFAVAEQCGNDFCIQGWECKQSRCLPNDPCWFPPHCVPAQRQPWSLEESTATTEGDYEACRKEFVDCQNRGGDFYYCQADFFRCRNGN